MLTKETAGEVNRAISDLRDSLQWIEDGVALAADLDRIIPDERTAFREALHNVAVETKVLRAAVAALLSDKASPTPGGSMIAPDRLAHLH